MNKPSDQHAYLPALHWHPRFNHYVMSNQDVLLISATEQFLLKHQEYLFLSSIDGKKNADQILAENQNLNSSPGAQFHYQILQLTDWGLLSPPSFFSDKNKSNELRQLYLRPAFDSEDSVSSHSLVSTVPQVHWLSALPGSVLAEIEAWFLSLPLENIQTLDFIFVDDFLDPRLQDIQIETHFLLIKISGEDIWIGPVLSKRETGLFKRMQQRILDNQPVRKSLMRQWPNSLHGYPFKVPPALTGQQKQTLTGLIIEQIGQIDKVDKIDRIDITPGKELLVYSVANNQINRHPFNPELGNEQNFAQQIQSPIQLKNCIASFNQDGGSRCVAAQDTVEKLSSLVSPITGIINHFIELSVELETPIKIYRTGFYKATLQPMLQFEQNSFVQTCLGKGVSPIQSQASALAEAVERYCALYQDDVPLIKSTLADLSNQGMRTIGFREILPHSNQQYQNFCNPAHPDAKRAQAVKPYDSAEIHWIPCYSLSHHEFVHIPLTLCFNQTPFNEQCYGRWNSNGCAAGNSLEEAILQGLLELCERDATAIWWYNQITRPIFDLSGLDQNYLAQLAATIQPDADHRRDFWVLDITTDTGVPVMAAIGKNQANGTWTMGFGCHLVPEMAAQRALTELCQLLAIRNNHAAPFDFDAIQDSPFLYGHAKAEKVAYTVKSACDIKQDILSIVNNLNDLGLETIVLNYSRATIPLNTAKVWVPGLCHIWPQFANQRLYEVPVKSGWLSVQKNENELNQQALYI